MSAIPSPPIVPAANRPFPAGAIAKGAALALAAAAAALLPLLLFVMGPKFDEIYRDFGVQIPPLTAVFISLSRLLVSIGVAGSLLIVLLLPAAVLGLGRVGWRSPALIALLTLLCCGVFIAFMASMYTPLIEMIESLRSAPAPSPGP